MALFEPVDNEITADVLVVGGGISGITTAIEIAEVGKKVILAESTPTLGGRVASFYQYFPKMCPPSCGLEINLRRIKNTNNITVLTLATVTSSSGNKGSYNVQITLNPRYINEKCTACGECEKVCDLERSNDFNYGIDTTKAVYLPSYMAFPFRYVVDPAFAQDEKMKKCVDACKYGAFDLNMQPRTITAKVGSIVWATGWKPYDATKLDTLGFGTYDNVITNVIMERLAAENGPTGGQILRPSDKKEITSIGFVQCAGSRDQNHLPYCSAVCCLASMKQANYIRSKYPDATVHIFYIDIRSPGRLEDYYASIQEDEKVIFHRGKVAKITENPDTKNLLLEAEDTLTATITQTEVDMAVLATGMVPNTVDHAPVIDTQLDDFGFIVSNTGTGAIGAGTSTRPFDVSSSVQDATGAALKAIIEARG